MRILPFGSYSSAQQKFLVRFIALTEATADSLWLVNNGTAK